MVGKQADMMSGLINKQGEIIDSRLGINQQQPQAVGGTPQPLRRPNWGQVRANYEDKKRKEFWEAKIAEVEARDKQKAVQKPEVGDVST